MEIQNKFFWLSLQFKQKGDQPKTHWKEKHSLSGPWVPLNFCKEIVVLGKEQKLKVGAQQKPFLYWKLCIVHKLKNIFLQLFALELDASWNIDTSSYLAAFLQFFCNYLHYDWMHLEIQAQILQLFLEQFAL